MEEGKEDVEAVANQLNRPTRIIALTLGSKEFTIISSFLAASGPCRGPHVDFGTVAPAHTWIIITIKIMIANK